MKVEHKDAKLARLETDPGFTGGHAPSIVKAYRKRLNYIRNAQDERDLYAWKSLEFEKLKKPRDHQHSVRLNDQWRLILEFSGDAPNKALVIVAIEDYH
jgi:proteic killer suppression protein